MKKPRVVVAMSGGVDSSTAAWLLKKQGYEVIGATMCIGATHQNGMGSNRCCGFSDIEDARRIALQLGIPFFVFSFKEEFEKEIIDYFCKEYLEGKTPNPCILCNEKLKFGAFLNRAKEMGADYVATGHYARLEFDGVHRRYLLKRGIDRKKDQSYVLFSLSQDQLRQSLFPLGDFHKEEVRRMAYEANLRVYNKPESQEVCFIPETSYYSFLSERLKEGIQEGPILDLQGNRLGKHRGIPFYTIGQRRGLRLAKGKPLYVIGIDRVKNAVVVGEEKEVYRKAFLVHFPNWIKSEQEDIPIICQVKIRYNHPGAEATLYKREDHIIEVHFQTPQKAITPGQAAVFYHGDYVLGGGWIGEVKN